MLVYATGEREHTSTWQSLVAPTRTWACRLDLPLWWYALLCLQSYSRSMECILCIFLYNPEKRKSRGVRSGDLGDRSIECLSASDARLVHSLGNTLFKYINDFNFGRSPLQNINNIATRNKGNAKTFRL